MAINKNFKQFPFTISAVLLSVTMLVSSCGTFTAALQTETSVAQSGNNEPQFIEDFYLTENTEIKAVMPRSDKNPAQNSTAHQCVSAAAVKQVPIPEELVILGDNIRAGENADHKNIGGIDFASPEEAEDFEGYDDLFVANELNAGEAFDPTKMTDSIPVYLVSPWSSCYNFPLKSSKINSDFGWRHSRFHSGIDLDLETGDDVVASFDGIVKRADYVSGYGNLVVVKHFNGLETYYAHLSKILVTEGDTLTAGDKLGLGGSTGRSTGPHLHYEIRYRGAAIDPKYVVDFKNANLYNETFYLKKEYFKPSTTAATSTGTTGAKYYTVKKGDTLSKIASRNKTTVAKICKLNGISQKKVLKPGQRLRIR